MYENLKRENVISDLEEQDVIAASPLPSYLLTTR